MTKAQAGLVRETFEQLREAPEPILLLFYGRLFDLDPTLRPLFKVEMKSQALKLSEMLEAVVNSLDHFETLRPVLRDLGRRHVGYGVKPEHYETLASALLWAFGQALQPNFDSDAREAWRAALGAVVDAMLAQD